MKNYLNRVVLSLIALLVSFSVQDVYSESKYTINYYVGNGATTKGVTQIGTSTCEYGKECQLKLFETLLSETESGVSSFPLPSRQWSFYGWVKEEQKNSELENIDYIDGDKFTINLDDIQNDILNVYAIGKREFIFWSGISPTNGEDRVMQYWNPYLRSTTYVSIVSIPKATEIPSWEFLGYRANDDVTADVTIAGNLTSLKADPYSYTDLFFRSKYQRQLTLKYNANGGSGSLISDSQMQYYSSGIGVDGKNEGAKISTASTWILLNNQYTRNGYVFYGWGETPNDEDANGPGVHYGYFYPGVSDNSTKEIYAIWKEESKYGRIVGRYDSYENAIKIVKELMRDYFVKGPLIKYNSAKKTYGIDNPEEATSQDTMYKTCTGYTYSVYVEAFGMNRSVDNFVRGSFEILDVARDYYNAHKNNLESLNGNYLLYYEKKETTDKYVYDNKENINDFIELLRPGDILVYTGHGLIVYDKVKKSDGTWDVLILNAVNEGEIRSRNYGTSKLYYSINTLSTGLSSIIHLDNVGTIKPLMMKNSQFVTDDKLSCKQTECAIIRPFYNDDGYANFNYSILKSYYDKSMLRVKYPNLTIEKTVDKGDNNSVYLNDTLSYKIKLTNNSSFVEDDNTIAEVSGYLNEDGSYKDNLIVEEDLGEYISYVDSSIDAIINNESVVGNGVVVQYDSQNNKIRWTIDGSALKQGKNNSIELVFKVKVPQNYSFIDKKIEATGKIYNSLDANVYITTGTVLNTIIPKVSEYQMSYNECFNSLKDNFEGLELINQIYKCSNNVDLKLDEFDFENVIGGINQDEPEYAQLKTKFLREYPNTVYLKDNNVYKKMILNNYWNKQLELKLDSNKLFLHLPRYSGEQSKYRAKTINSIDFKNGDVLIYYVKYIQNDNRFKNLSDTELGKVSDATYRKKYTNEDGIYAFIYLDGKFIGRNYTGEANERNEFTYEYYIKDLTDDTEKLAALKDNLYSAASLSNVEVLKYVNYQSLYDKNDYVILRPESSIEQVDSIVINSEPQKKDYYAGESLNLDGIDVSATYNNGKQESAPISDLVISGYSSIVGNQTVTIEYKGKTAEFNVNVMENSNTLKSTLENNGYNVINGYVLLTLDDNVDTIINKLDGDVTIETNNDILTTGAVIKNDNESYTVVVKGDINKDGKIGALDYIAIRNHMMGTNIMNSNSIDFLVADMNSDDKISALDYIAIRNIMMGI